MKKILAGIALSGLLVLSFLAGRSFTRAGSGGGAQPRRILYYVDPMHPAYRSSKPGIAPDCGMKLEPVYADDAKPAPTDGAAADPSASQRIHIDAAQRQLAGIRSEPVERSTGSSTLRVVGKVAFDDTRVYRVNAGAGGWIRDTFDTSIGSYVRKDEKLASFYSPDFVSLEQGYLVATERQVVGMKPAITAPGTQTTSSRLRNLGMSDAQIEQLRQTRQLPESIEILAPHDGFIVARSLSPGEKFEMGNEFYRIADLRHVWILAELSEEDAQRFKPGTVAEIAIPNQPLALHARVSSALPQFDPATHTMKLRLEADNPSYLLRPDMLVDVDLPAGARDGLSIDADALVDSGLRKEVFVDSGDDYFEPRAVETGWRSDGRVQIVKGLREGERVVSAGTFLVSSEARLHAPLAGVPISDGSPAVQPAASSDGKQRSAGTAMSLRAQSGKDPKCGMQIDVAESRTAGNTLDRDGKTYYFCSKKCKQEFAKEPEHYLAMNSAGGQL